MLSKKLKVLSLFIVIAVGLWSIRIYNSHRPRLEKQTRFMMDTYVTISAAGPAKITSRAIDLALDRMQQVDTKFNSLNPKSPIFAFNHQGIALSDPEVLDLVRTALEVSRRTGGAFDITVAPLLELWGFYGQHYRLPRDEEIKEYLPVVDYRYLTLENGALERKKEGVQIDLGGLAKGYAISEAARVLKENSVQSALIDAGGDIYAVGKKGNKLWKVGIRSPRREELIGYVKAEDLAVMGSGDYERFFIKDGKRYHHILNPKTGYPAEGLSGITVVYPDPVLADAWATALFVMGPQKGLEMVKNIPGMKAVMVTTEGEVLPSAGINDALHVIPETQKQR